MPEDLLVGVVVALVLTHPWAALAVSMTLLALGFALLLLLWRRLRAARARRRAGTTPAGSAGSSARSP